MYNKYGHQTISQCLIACAESNDQENVADGEVSRTWK